MEDQDKIIEIEHRIEILGRRVDDIAERTGQRIDPGVACKPYRSNGRTFWGVIFLVVGFVWLANRMGWFFFDVPLAATVLIVAGLYMIVTSRR